MTVQSATAAILGSGLRFTPGGDTGKVVLGIIVGTAANIAASW
jgi:hypothetical protein